MLFLKLINSFPIGLNVSLYPVGNGSLFMLLLFVFVGIPLILDYHAEAKWSSINEQNNTEIIFIKKGETLKVSFGKEQK